MTDQQNHSHSLTLPSLEAVFDFSIIQSILVVGNAGLFQEVKSKYPSIRVSDSAQEGLFDLTIGFSGNAMDLAKATKHTLVWCKAPVAEDAVPENFALWTDVGEKLNAQVFRSWNFLKPDSSYFVQQLNSDDSNHHLLHIKPGLYYSSMQEAFLKLTRRIKEISASGKPASIVRASDGDYYFMRKVEIGSAKPGKRALTKSYDSVNIPLFRKLFWDNDIISVSIEPDFHKSWKKFLFYESFDKFFWKLNFKFRGQNTFKYINYAFEKVFGWLISSSWFVKLWLSVFASETVKQHKAQALEILEKHQTPMEAVYSLVPTKWIFRNFKNEIGVIAGTYKCELIKLLMQRKEYQDYLGMDSFSDYIEVPQKGAADNLEALAEEIGKQIQNSKTKIFLVGAGSVKMGLLPLLKKYSNAIFIDVGAGIDALAGVVCQERPYFCEWADYRINGYDYEKVDFMDQGNPAWDKPEYHTIWID